LLESELNDFGGIGFVRSAHQTLNARDVGARRLLAVDVFARLDGSLEMLGMEENRRGDEHGVEVRRCPQVGVVFVGRRVVGARNFRFGAVDLIVTDVLERRDADARALGEYLLIVAAPAAGPMIPSAIRELT
jgi:hypothetical protein